MRRQGERPRAQIDNDYNSNKTPQKAEEATTVRTN